MADDSQQVTVWMEQLRQGNEEAARKLWDRYFDQLARLARKQLSARQRVASDEEDVAASVFESLCKGAQAGRFDHVDDRTELWRLLLAMTKRKIIDSRRRSGREKRGGKLQQLDLELSDSSRLGGLDQLVGQDPTPEDLAALNEQLERVLASLPNETVRVIAHCKLEGVSNRELAARFDVSVKTIERKIHLIRMTWESIAQTTD